MNSTSAGQNTCAGEFELKMHEKSKQDPRCKSIDQSERTIRITWIKGATSVGN
jgi:hypothetical protein